MCCSSEITMNFFVVANLWKFRLSPVNISCGKNSGCGCSSLKPAWMEAHGLEFHSFFFVVFFCFLFFSFVCERVLLICVCHEGWCFKTWHETFPSFASLKGVNIWLSKYMTTGFVNEQGLFFQTKNDCGMTPNIGLAAFQGENSPICVCI